MNNSQQKQNRDKLKKFILLSFFLAIMVLLGFTPIGIIDLPFIKATILHIPVIIGSIFLGPYMGAALGLCFGTISLIKNTMAPSLISFVFSPLIPFPPTGESSLLALVVCFLPRILVGVIPYFVYVGLDKALKNKKFSKTLNLTICGIVGSMVNTLLVMGLIYALFKNEFAAVKEIAPESVAKVVMSIVFINGVPEAILSAFLVSLISIPLFKRRSNT